MDKIKNHTNKFKTHSVELFYNQDLNRFINNDGEIIHDLHGILEPWQINHAKNLSKESCYVVLETSDGDFVEIFFPESFTDEDLFWEIYEDRKEFGA